MTIKIALFALIGLTTIACNNGVSLTKDGNVNISGTLENAESKVLVLEQFVNGKPVIIDSSVVNENGGFELATDATVLDFYRIRITPQNASVFLLSPGEKITISGDGGDLNTSLSVEGSENTKLLWSYYKEANSYGEKSQELRTQAGALTQDQGEKKQNIINEFNKINEDFISFTKTFIDENSSSPAVLPAIGNLNIETDLEYFEKARDGLKENFGGSSYYTSLNNQISQYKKSQEQNKMFEPGNETPDITQNDPSGNPRSLSDLRGKIVLVDFWAAWCRPCRAENPNVVKLYNKYNKDGFDVFSVSLDKTKDKWVAAIEKDGLVWPNHVSDLKYWSSEAAQLYNVKSIPFTVLLDKEGKVIGTKLRGAALEAKLKEIFGY